MNVAIILARKGSKRIPEKNSRVFNGRPMVEWPILTAIHSKCFDKIIVSTDSEYIAEISVRLGAEVPSLRPPNLSGDFVGSSEVVRHEILQLQASGYELGMICELYATSVMLEVNDLKDSFEYAKSNKKFVFSAAAYRSPVYRSFKIQSGVVEMLFPDCFNNRSQDLPDVYHDAGQFYWGDAKKWLQDNFIFGEKTLPYVLDNNKVIDIDTMSDWILAEAMHLNKENLSV